jgi:hypothetical protein
MPRATCRCGQVLNFPDEGSDRIVCPKCQARVRVRRRPAPSDGFLRFFCPCGRRLKVSAADPPSHGKCPDCGRIVPVPRSSGPGSRPPGHPEADTTDLSPEDLAALDAWSRRHAARSGDLDAGKTPQVVIVKPAQSPSSTRAEAGLRVCPNCKRPVHLGADVCRACGTPVPRK